MKFSHTMAADLVRRRITVALLPAVTLAAIAGCGSSGGAPTVPAAGVVTFNGQPVPNVNVTFTPSAGRSATGQTDPNGAFVLSTFVEGDGAVEGDHKVTLSVSTADVPMPGTPEAESYETPALPFPEKYRGLDTTDLKVSLGSSGNKEISVVLASE